MIKGKTYVKTTIKALCAASVIAMTTGCASILTDETANINVQTTNGDPAKISVDGVEHTIPGLVTVQKDGKDKFFVAATDNCVNQTAVPKKVESAFWLNILSGGSFGSSTDYSTDKMWTYSDSVTVSCK